MYAATKSVNLWELTHKILLRYLTPSRIAKFSPQASPLCWRNCGCRGTLYHIMWTCPAIRAFWSKTFSLITQIIGAPVPFFAGMAILSLGIESVPVASRVIVTHILLSAGLIIMRHRKDLRPPPITEIVDTTNIHVTYEMMFASTQGNYQTMCATWNQWVEWYKRCSKGIGNE